MKLWLYGQDEQDICFLLTKVTAQDHIVGSSTRRNGTACFPYGGLVRPIQAAIRGELQCVLLSQAALPKGSLEELEEIRDIFSTYQVSVRSVSNADSSSS